MKPKLLLAGIVVTLSLLLLASGYIVRSYQQAFAHSGGHRGHRGYYSHRDYGSSGPLIWHPNRSYVLQFRPVFVILALLPWIIQAAIQAAKVKVILVSRQVTQEMMGTQEVLSISDNETHWFVPWIVILVRGTGKYIAKDDYTNV